MTTSTSPLPVRVTARRDTLAHAENPARPGYGLCGIRLSGKGTSATRSACLVCLDLTRPDWSSR